MPAFNAALTIRETLESIEASIGHHRGRGGGDERVAISVVDDASSDATVEIVTAFARATTVDIYLTVHDRNRGRATARNRALAEVGADHCFFLDHDDSYLPEHITLCLRALATHPRVDFVKTAVVLPEPVHPDWQPRIAAGLTQNLCVRHRAHSLLGGFHEEAEVELYGCDDVLYNRTLRALFRGLELPQPTVRFGRHPGNSFDRQYRRKFSRPASLAEVTLTPAQLRVESRVLELQTQRVDEVRARLSRIQALRVDPAPMIGAPAAAGDAGPRAVGDPGGSDREGSGSRRRFADEGERIYALMVTGKNRARARLAQASLESFRSQSYPNRALILVNDGDFDLDLSDLPGDRVLSIRPSGRRSLGALRNLGLEAVPDGALWTYWDDDDWHHPRLLEAQRRVLEKVDVPACFLTHQVKYDLVRDVAFVDSHPGGFAATLLAFKHPSLRFPDCAAGEDTIYTEALKLAWRWFPWSNPCHFFLRLHHGGNTWDTRHFGLADRAPGSWSLPARAALYLRSVLPLYGVGNPPTDRTGSSTAGEASPAPADPSGRGPAS